MLYQHIIQANPPKYTTRHQAQLTIFIKNVTTLMIFIITNHSKSTNIIIIHLYIKSLNIHNLQIRFLIIYYIKRNFFLLLTYKYLNINF